MERGITLNLTLYSFSVLKERGNALKERGENLEIHVPVNAPWFCVMFN